MRFGSIFHKSRPKRKIQRKGVRVDKPSGRDNRKDDTLPKRFFEKGVVPGKRSLNTSHNIPI